jgi:hypothetical protein
MLGAEHHSSLSMRPDEVNVHCCAQGSEQSMGSPSPTDEQIAAAYLRLSQAGAIDPVSRSRGQCSLGSASVCSFDWLCLITYMCA